MIRWAEKTVSGEKLDCFTKMTPLQKVYFLDCAYSQNLSLAILQEMDSLYGLTSCTNVEIALGWFLLAIKYKHRPAYRQIKQYLGTHGRMKYNRPIYQYARLILTSVGR